MIPIILMVICIYLSKGIVMLMLGSEHYWDLYENKVITGPSIAITAGMIFWVICLILLLGIGLTGKDTALIWGIVVGYPMLLIVIGILVRKKVKKEYGV